MAAEAARRARRRRSARVVAAVTPVTAVVVVAVALALLDAQPCRAEQLDVNVDAEQMADPAFRCELEQLRKENAELRANVQKLQRMQMLGGLGEVEQSSVLSSPSDLPGNSSLAIVVVGASGDLAKKKTFPSLYQLHVEGLLPPRTLIFGYARSKLSNDDFRTMLRGNCKNCAPDVLESFLSRCHYHAGQYNSPSDFAALTKHLGELEAQSTAERHAHANRVFYLAIPPSVFVDVARTVHAAGMSASGWNRMVIEKPFGQDLASSRALQQDLGALFEEAELYRIDHYLGKEMVQALLALRFANRLFEPIWSHKHISNVMITFKEDIGTQGRGGYFDQFGIIRDVMQNHLFQILALIAMEPPVTKHANDIRDEKVKVLRSIPTLDSSDVVVGQYNGYKDDKGVPADSITPTFASAVLHVNNARWKGVPFFIKCGKALNERKAEIRIQFRDPEVHLFKHTSPNELVIRVQPNEAIYFKMYTKQPGLNNNIALVDLDLTVKERFELDKNLPDAYERLILDVIRGDQNLFVRSDEIDTSWRILTPLLHTLDNKRVQPHVYEHGSRGPHASDDLFQRHGWRRTEGYVYRDPANKAIKANKSDSTANL